MMSQGLKAALQHTWKFWLEVGDELVLHKASLMAAGIAYFAVLAVFPLLLVVMAAGAAIIGSSQKMLDLIYEGLSQIMIPSAVGTIITVISEAIDSGLLVGGLSILLLVWAATHVFRLTSTALDSLWRAKHRPRAVVNILRSLLVVTVLTVSGLLAFGLTVTFSLIENWSAEHPMVLGLTSLFSPMPSWTSPLLGFGLTLIFYTLAHKYLPTRKIAWKYALVAGMLSGTMSEAAKLLFTLLVVRPGSYLHIYGPIAGMVLLVLWFYYAANCLLIGAAAARLYEKQELAQQGEEV